MRSIRVHDMHQPNNFQKATCTCWHRCYESQAASVAAGHGGPEGIDVWMGSAPRHSLTKGYSHLALALALDSVIDCKGGGRQGNVLLCAG